MAANSQHTLMSEVRERWDQVKEIDLEPITDKASHFAHELPQRSAEVVKQIRQKVTRRRRNRRQEIGGWLRSHQWAPVVGGLGLIVTIMVIARARQAQS